MNKKKPVALVILDGWGFLSEKEHINMSCNAIVQAHPKTFNFLWSHYPHVLLKASGTAVGLPEGIPGNSEVGHMTIGAGRIIEQPLTQINHAIQDGSFFHNQGLLKLLKRCVNNNGRLHLLGLLSDGCVHSNNEHLFALIQAAHEQQVPELYVHAFLDGRDVAPMSAQKYLEQLDQVLNKYGGNIGSIAGRFYAMDRDENWDRTLAVYDMLCGKNVVEQASWQDVVKKNYAEKITDEFMYPTLLNSSSIIRDHDTLIFFNIRPDRIRQLVSLFLDVQISSEKHKQSPDINPPAYLTIATMVSYYKFFHTDVLFPESVVQHTLLDILEGKQKTMFTIAETQKYAHVTYFFSGGKEAARNNETRVLIPSKSVSSYAQVPEMSAQQITDAIIHSLITKPCDFYLVNYANADMVGHSGNFDATIQAVLYIDKQLKTLYDILVMQLGGTLYITADHGKAEEMWDFRNHGPRTSHTVNPVPFIMVHKHLEHKQEDLPLYQLADIAPFILKTNFQD